MAGSVIRRRSRREGALPQGARTFRRRLLAWYGRHRRALPWRGTRDPYAILVSEFMLQQTQVSRVMGHYPRFLRAYPTLEDLAAAPAGAVRERWQGLGHYARARHLHAAARAVVDRHGGAFPADPDALRRLPGIGPYTAGAVASIAFGLASVSLMGLPPSGGFIGKWLLLQAALASRAWWLVAVIIAGGFIVITIWVHVIGGRS